MPVTARQKLFVCCGFSAAPSSCVASNPAVACLRPVGESTRKQPNFLGMGCSATRSSSFGFPQSFQQGSRVFGTAVANPSERSGGVFVSIQRKYRGRAGSKVHRQANRVAENEPLSLVWSG